MFAVARSMFQRRGIWAAAFSMALIAPFFGSWYFAQAATEPPAVLMKRMAFIGFWSSDCSVYPDDRKTLSAFFVPLKTGEIFTSFDTDQMGFLQGLIIVAAQQVAPTKLQVKLRHRTGPVFQTALFEKLNDNAYHIVSSRLVNGAETIVDGKYLKTDAATPIFKRCRDGDLVTREFVARARVAAQFAPPDFFATPPR